MKKTHKKVFGLLGLALVVSMTAVAALIPAPETSAATSTSFTDNISVRVIDSVPSINVVSPASGEEVTSRDNPIVIDYTNLKRYTVTITYTDEDGNEHTEVIDDVTTTPETEESGTISYDFRPIAETYGYGNFTVTLTGEGLDGSAVEDSVDFEYIATEVEIEGMDDHGGLENPSEVKIDLNYDDDDSLSDDDRIAQIIVEVFDENGNRVEEIPTIVVTPPQKQVVINFEQYDIPSGYYTIKVTPYSVSGKELYKETKFTVYYDGSIVVPSTADTGGLFKGLNISSTDYLITGVGVFLVIGIGGFVFVSKRNKR